MPASQQVDLFLDSLVNAPLKDDRALMEHPFFALAKNPRFDPIEYDDGRVKIRVTAGEKGIATIWDKDILIYVASLLNDRIERGAPVERTMRFAAYDFLRLTGRGTSATVYQQMIDALFRLRSTTITTSIASAGEQDDRGFGWIDSYRVVRREAGQGERRVMAAIEVTLTDWMYRALVKERRVLTINPRYFQLTKGIERRLYELARKHLGRQADWTIGLGRLAEKVGSVRDLRKFKSELSAIIEADTIPDFGLALLDPPPEVPARRRNEETKVCFWHRDSAVDVSPPGTPGGVD